MIHKNRVSICDACYLVHQRLPLLGSPCQILGLVQLGGPMAAVAAVAAAVAAAALGTQLLVCPPLIHPAGIYHFAVVSGMGFNNNCVKGTEACFGGQT